MINEYNVTNQYLELEKFENFELKGLLAALTLMNTMFTMQTQLFMYLFGIEIVQLPICIIFFILNQLHRVSIHRFPTNWMNPNFLP